MILSRRGCGLVLSLLLAVSGSFAQVRLDLTPGVTNASVRLTGANGQEYVVEAATDGVGPANWAPFSSFVITNGTRAVADPFCGFGSRFFRARERGADEIDWAPNFRLIDQFGKSHELYYHLPQTTLKGIVLIFAQGDYADFASKINKLAANPLFSSSILFWGVDTDPNNTRTNIAAKAVKAGIAWPILHDPQQFLAREFNANFHGEALLLKRDEMRVLYRGAIIDSVGNAFLGDALTNLVKDLPLSMTRLEPWTNRFTRVRHDPADYSTVIAPIIKAKCVVCHSPNNIAPFALTAYEAVVTNALPMKDAILSARMPPWHADAEYGTFHNDLSLSRTEKAQLVDWITAGQPRGEGPDSLIDAGVAEPDWPVELGPPDQIVTIAAQPVPARGTLAYRYIYANATNATDKWLRAAIVKPSNKRVVHHYIVWEGHSNSAQLSGIAGYAPGKNEGAYPEGTGVLLKANCDLTFNLHYTADGVAETDQPVLGLWYAKAPPARAYQQATPVSFALFFGSIPAGNGEFEVTAAQTFSSAATIYSFSPHMHVRGLRMRFDLTLPDGTKRTLLSVPKYNFGWQTIYTLATPLDIPANSRVDIVGAFDNSVLNLDNPDPTKAITWGEQSWDEMFIGYMDYANR